MVRSSLVVKWQQELSIEKPPYTLLLTSILKGSCSPRTWQEIYLPLYRWYGCYGCRCCFFLSDVIFMCSIHCHQLCIKRTTCFHPMPYSLYFLGIHVSDVYHFFFFFPHGVWYKSNFFFSHHQDWWIQCLSEEVSSGPRTEAHVEKNFFMQLHWKNGESWLLDATSTYHVYSPVSTPFFFFPPFLIKSPSHQHHQNSSFQKSPKFQGRKSSSSSPVPSYTYK